MYEELDTEKMIIKKGVSQGKAPVHIMLVKLVRELVEYI